MHIAAIMNQSILRWRLLSWRYTFVDSVIFNNIHSTYILTIMYNRIVNDY